MYLVDYHLHSKYSMDSEEEIINICNKAVEQRVSEIAITDHVELQNPTTFPNFKAREAEIVRLNKFFGERLTVKSGMEIGQAHRFKKEAENIFASVHMDFVIGSLHETEQFGSHAKISFTKSNIESFFEAYFDELLQLARYTDYDVLGHITLPFRYIPDDLLVTYSPEHYFDKYDELLKTVIARGKGIEVNASGLRTKLQVTMPPLSLLKLYRQLKGEVITIGSDGHSCRSALYGIDECVNLLREAGFEHYSTFVNRSCEMIDL